MQKGNKNQINKTSSKEKHDHGKKGHSYSNLISKKGNLTKALNAGR